MRPRVLGSRARGTGRPDSGIDVLYSLRSERKLGWEIEQLCDEQQPSSASQSTWYRRGP
jgi:predicted nucleotidyltransferase